MMRLRTAILALLPLLAAPERPVTIHLAGDSTMASKRPEKRPETGWGEYLAAAFDSTRVRVVNHAQNGRSTRTFIAEGRWQAIVDSLRSGDWVFIQFGHNDQSREKVDRYTPPDDFRRNLERMVREARAKGATPVLLTPVMRRRFDSTGVFYDVHGEYPDLTRRVSYDLKVPLLDMHRSSERLLREYGADRSRSLFLQLKSGEHPNYPEGIEDNTHFSPQGAALMSSLAVDGIRALGLDIARHLRPGTGTNSAGTPASAPAAAPADCFAELKRTAPRRARTLGAFVSPSRDGDKLQRPWADSLATRVAAELRLPDSLDTPFITRGDPDVGDENDEGKARWATIAPNLLVRVEAGRSGEPTARLLTSSMDPALDAAVRQAVERALSGVPAVKGLRPVDVELLVMPLPGSRGERTVRKAEQERRLVARPVAERMLPHVRQTTAPRLLPYSRPPVYPPELRRRGRKGSVKLRFLIDARGHVVPGSTVVLEATEPEFASAALEALPAARFDPAVAEGTCPVATPVQQPFHFRIGR